MLILFIFVQQWDGGFFKHTDLRTLGLVVQLGHAPYQACLTAQQRLMVIIHTNGIHQVRVGVCRCLHAPELRTQLLRHTWWPATVTDPQTCATREALSLFHTLNLNGNLTGTDFYRGLESLTDSRRILDLPVRSLSLLYHGVCVFIPIFRTVSPHS